MEQEIKNTERRWKLRFCAGTQKTVMLASEDSQTIAQGDCLEK